MRPRSCGRKPVRPFWRRWRRAGNPSSVHGAGRGARRLVEQAREQVAALVGAMPREVVFTSGGTEANVLALSPAFGDVLLVSAIEHPSVRAGGRFAAAEEIPVRADGRGRSRCAQAPSRRRVAAVGFDHARQQRDRRRSAGGAGGRTRACGGRPSACRCGAGAGQDRLRFQGARRRPDDAVRAQDRRAAGRRRADQARHARS